MSVPTGINLSTNFSACLLNTCLLTNPRRDASMSATVVKVLCVAVLVLSAFMSPVQVAVAGDGSYARRNDISYGVRIAVGIVRGTIPRLECRWHWSFHQRQNFSHNIRGVYLVPEHFRSIISFCVPLQDPEQFLAEVASVQRRNSRAIPFNLELRPYAVRGSAGKATRLYGVEAATRRPD